MYLKEQLKRLLALVLCMLVLFGFSVCADDEIGDDLSEEDGFGVDDQPVFSGSHLLTTIYDDIEFDGGNVFQDVTDEYDMYVVSVVNGLGLMEGINSNTFGADESISRGSFLKLVLKLLNIDSIKVPLDTYFTDVDKASEFAESVSLAVKCGLIRGSGDNMFYPERAITCDEAGIMIARALGYTALEGIPGEMGRAMTHLAAQEDLFYGAENTGNNAITRMDAAYIIYNSTSIPVLQPISFGDNISFSKDEGNTLLSLYHDIKYTIGKVNATCVSSLNGYRVCTGDRLTVGETVYETGGKDYSDLFGHEVEVWYSTQEDVSSIVYLNQSRREKTLVLKADDIENFKDLKYTYYTSGNRMKAVSIAPRHTLIVNGICLNDYMEQDFVPANGYVELLSSNGDNYDVVIVNTYHSFLLSKLESDKNGMVTFQTLYDMPIYSLDLSEEDRLVAFYLNGRKISFSNIAISTFDADGFAQIQYKMPALPENVSVSFFADKYDVIRGHYIPSEDARIVKIFISDASISGKWKGISEDYINIDGQKVEVAGENLFDAAEMRWEMGDSGKVLLDYDGKAFAVVSEAVDEYNYAYLIDASLDRGALSNKLVMKLLHTDGSIKVYSEEDCIIVNDAKKENMREVHDMLLASAKLVSEQNRISQVVKVKLREDGTVSHMQILKEKADTQDALTKDWGRGKLMSRSENKYMLFPKTGDDAYKGLFNGGWKNMFVVPEVETGDDLDYSVVQKWLPSNTEKTVEIYDVNEHLIPGIIVAYYEPESNELANTYAMVDHVRHELDKNGNYIGVLYCANLIDDRTGALEPVYSENMNLFDELKKGDLIKLFGLGRRVKKWEMVLSIDEVKNFDMDTLPQKAGSSQKYDIYELYSARISGLGNSLVLQRGPVVSGAKRQYQQINTAGYGFIYDETAGRDGEVDMFYKNAQYLDAALNVGNEAASYVYVWESTTVTKFMAAYKFK